MVVCKECAISIILYSQICHFIYMYHVYHTFLVACGRNGFHFDIHVHFIYLDLHYMYFAEMKLLCLMSFVLLMLCLTEYFGQIYD